MNIANILHQLMEQDVTGIFITPDADESPSKSTPAVDDCLSNGLQRVSSSCNILASSDSKIENIGHIIQFKKECQCEAV